MRELEILTRDGPMYVDLPDGWVNYGDASPRRHGGMYATFEDRGVQVIETRPPQSIPDDVATDSHLVWPRYLHYGDVIHHDADHSYAVDTLRRELDSFGDIGTVTEAAVDGRLPMALVWCTSRRHSCRDHWVHDCQYSETLQERWGVAAEVLPGYE
jgi:hypothetical protein